MISSARLFYPNFFQCSTSLLLAALPQSNANTKTLLESVSIIAMLYKQSFIYRSLAPKTSVFWKSLHHPVGQYIFYLPSALYGIYLGASTSELSEESRRKWQASCIFSLLPYMATWIAALCLSYKASPSERKMAKANVFLETSLALSALIHYVRPLVD